MILKILAKAATVGTLSPTSMRGECVVATEIHSKPKGSVQNGDVQECIGSESTQYEKWECHNPLSDSELAAILSFRAAFDLSVEEARQALAKYHYHGCPNGHYTKCREFLLQDFVHCVGFSTVELKGHPIVCHTGDSCSIYTQNCLHPFPCVEKVVASRNRCSELS